MKDRGDGISSSQASATGLLQLAFKRSRSSMTITTAITIKMGSVPRLTCKRARRVDALPPAHNFPLQDTIPEVDERRQMGAHAAATQPSAQISPSVHQIVRLLAVGAAPQVTSAAYPHVRRLIGQ